MSKKEKNAALSCVWHIALSVFLTFIAMALSSLLISNILLKDVKNALLRSLVSDVILLAVYAISFYKFHQSDRILTYAKHEKQFDVKAEILAYLRGEGKYLVMFFAVCAVLREIFHIIPASALSLVGQIFVDILLNPMATYIKIPVLSSILAFLYACAMLCFLVALRSRKVYLEDLNTTRRR